MKTKSAHTGSTAARTAKPTKQTLRDLTAKQAGGVKGGAIKKLARTGN